MDEANCENKSFKYNSAVSVDWLPDCVFIMAMSSSTRL